MNVGPSAISKGATEGPTLLQNAYPAVEWPAAVLEEEIKQRGPLAIYANRRRSSSIENLYINFRHCFRMFRNSVGYGTMV